jgi:nucleotidyltransferase substrate binding protein (TIGR01987 family)
MGETMTEEAEKPRWQFRLDNFSRAYFLLREGIEELSERKTSQLEREGIIQRFEYTWELAWRTISDFLGFEGIVVSPVTPRAVIRAAFEAGVVSRGTDWMSALDDRNKMSHTYNFKAFENVIEQIQANYLSLFEELYESLTARALLE